MKVYAVHKSGKRLFYPDEDALGSRLVPRDEVAAISIDQNGVTFPPGTFYLLDRSGNLKPGWRRVDSVLKNAENRANSHTFSDHLPPERETLLAEG